MEVILLEKIRNLGDLGVKINVKSGFGRNFLIPKGKAVLANAANLAKFETRRAELEQRASEVLAAAKQKAEKLIAIGAITIKAKVADEGKLYGSVGVIEIAKAISNTGLTVAKNELYLPVGHIRQIGEYDVNVYFHSDVVASIKVNVLAE